MTESFGCNSNYKSVVPTPVVSFGPCCFHLIKSVLKFVIWISFKSLTSLDVNYYHDHIRLCVKTSTNHLCPVFLFLSVFATIEFRMVTRELCKLPSFFTTVLFGKIDKDNTEFVTR